MRHVAPAVCTLVVASATAVASPPLPPGVQPSAPTLAANAHRHDGFFARALVGIGGVSMVAGDIDTTISGTGGSIAIAAGWTVHERLIVFGEFFDNTATDPSVSSGDDEYELNDASLAALGLGAGVAYYLPSNLYVTGTVSAMRLVLDMRSGGDCGVTSLCGTGVGVGLSAGIGHEWWVSDNWALGLAGQAFIGIANDPDPDISWRARALAVMFSATYN